MQGKTTSRICLSNPNAKFKYSSIIPFFAFYVSISYTHFHFILMLPTHEKQEHNNDMWGKGLGMKYSNSRPVELNAINK